MAKLNVLECYTLEQAPWLNNEGFNKGLHHDRQQLGLILPAHTILRVRQSDITNGKATFRLLCNDSSQEKSLTLKTEWQEISATVDTVPFVDTLYTAHLSTFNIEFEEPEQKKELPFFNKDSNASVFFSLWSASKAAFGLVDTGSAKLLVPYADMDNLQKVNMPNGIYDLLKFYEEVFACYNKLAGLSFTPESPLNKNVANKYFIKADKNGSGSAYFSSSWCAENSSTIAQGWIDNPTTQWTILHEIAHGYQGNFMSDPRFSVKEVWNNIYGAWFQQFTLGNVKELYTDGWLYNYGKQASVEKTFRENIHNKIPANQWDLRSKLLLLMLMQFKSTPENFIFFNESYRALANSDNFNAADHHLMDMLSEATASVAGYDMTAFVDLCGVELDNETRERIYSLQTKPVYPLFDLLPESEWEDAQAKLGLRTPVWLVDNAEIAVLKKKGSITFNINIDNLTQIYGQDITIKDHCGNNHSLRITQNKMAHEYLPIGVYQVELPKGRSKKYSVDVAWFVVREGENNVNINYTMLNDTNSRDESIVFLGLSDVQFATLTVDNKNKNIVIDVTKSSPHTNYGNDTYASITIFSPDGEQIFNRNMPGKNCPITHDEIPFEEGFLIDVFHAECGHRLYSLPDYLNLVSHSEKYNKFRIDRTGLYNFSLKNNPDEDLTSIIAESAGVLRAEPLIYVLPDSIEKINIWLMIAIFSGETYDVLSLEYADVIPLNNSAPNELTGSNIHIELRGLNSYEFSEVIIDNSQYLMTVNTKKVKPHAYYHETYSWIRVWDKDGIEVYSRNYDGIINYSPVTETIPLSDGYVIDIYHDEPSRCVATNTMQNINFPLEQDNTWCVINTGLTNYPHPAAVTEQPTLRGNTFLWKLLGYYDVQFARLDINLVNNQLIYSTEAVTPHSRYGELYAEVRIIDNEGFMVYHQTMQGMEPLDKFTDTMTLAKGYIIEIYHAEASHRSVIVNTETGQNYNQMQKVVYQVIEKGLLLISEE